MKTRNTVKYLAIRWTKLSRRRFNSSWKYSGLLVLFLSAACGSFHAKELESSSQIKTGVVSVNGDGISHQPTPTPAVHATPTPTPAVHATPTPTAAPTASPAASPVATPTPLPTATPMASATPVAKVSATVRVMTFNIKGIPCLRDNVSDLVGLFGVKRCPAVSDMWTKHVPERVAQLLNQIQDLRNSGREPDVIFLQEAFTSKNDIFDDDAVLSIPSRSGYPYFAFGPLGKISNDIDDYWNLINDDRKKLKSLFSSGLLVLSKHPIRNQAAIEYGDICAIDDCNSNKSVMMVGIHHAGLGLDIDVFNTHMQAGSGQEPVRNIQADILTSFVQTHSTAPVKILGGDFNVRLQYNSEQVAKITSRLGVRDSGSLCPSSVNCTVAPGTDASRLAGDILDHVFIGANSPVMIAPVRGQIPMWTYGGYPLSDHDPVLIDLRIERPL